MPFRDAPARDHLEDGAALPCGCLPHDGAWQANLSWLTSDLAIGGRIPAERFAHLAGACGIGAVIDLRSEDRDDAVHLARHRIAFLHLPTDDLGAPTHAALRSGVAFAGRAGRRRTRLLIHCEHGIGRSATLALCVLVARGVEPLAALRLAKDRRALVSPSPAQYHAWVAWLETRNRRGAAVWTPDFDAFAAVAYRHLSGG